jgi:protease-4
LHEQRLARRWRNGVRLAWLGFFIALMMVGLNQTGNSQNVSTSHTAVVEIKGEIASGSEASAELVWPPCAAFEDVGAQAVVLLINSPGRQPGAGRHHQ